MDNQLRWDACSLPTTPSLQALLLERLIGDSGRSARSPFVLGAYYTFYSFYMCVRSLEPLVPHPQQAAAVLAWTLASELEVV